MFTGLVEDVGTVESLRASEEGGRSMTVETELDLEDLEVGASIAVDGVCLTVTAVEEENFAVDLSPETLQRSTLSERSVGDGVHLERPLRVGDRLGGHFVQGHVDGVAVISERERDGDGWRVTLEVPGRLGRYLVKKGSVALDGVSFTVAEVSEAAVTVAIIPHTSEETTFGDMSVGTEVNLEVDMLGKHVERLMRADDTETGGDDGTDG